MVIHHLKALLLFFFFFSTFSALLAANYNLDPAPDSDAFKYKTACGPISCFVALQTFGHDIKLEEIIDRCGWSEGNTTSLSTLKEFLDNRAEVSCSAVKMTPVQLKDYLSSKKYVAILPVRKHKDEIDHVICATHLTDDSINVVDYPEIKRNLSMTELTEIWDGQVLLVTPSLAYEFRSHIRFLILPVGILIFLMVLIVSDRIRKRGDSR